MLHRGFPSKLHHEVPSWVEDGTLFHVRIALDRTRPQRPLTADKLAPLLLDSVRFYEAKGRWFLIIFLVMPDHVHAILSFAPDKDMSRVVGDWKHYQAIGAVSFGKRDTLITDCGMMNAANNSL